MWKLLLDPSHVYLLPGCLKSDPGPGGLSSALTFGLGGPPSLVAGDLILMEPDHPSLLSDIIRFNPTGITPGYVASLVFYSDSNDATDTDLADTGFHTGLYANVVEVTESGTEAANGYLYATLPGQPGSIAGIAASYQIYSDGA